MSRHFAPTTFVIDPEGEDSSARHVGMLHFRPLNSKPGHLSTLAENIGVDLVDETRRCSPTPRRQKEIPAST